MFQTEPIHALQSFASEGLTGFMVGVSTLGYSWMLVPILVVVAFGLDFRRGFVLVQIAVWNGLATDVLKEYFFLPRPEAVDATLLQPGDAEPEIAPFVRMGAPGFWEPLPEEVLSYYRASGEFSRGFPSGHVSITTALWGSMALIFRKPALLALALTLIPLMMLSRMYLARHFLADVLGGVVVGLLMIGAAVLVLRRLPLPPFGRVSVSPTAGPTLLFFFGLPFLAAFVPGADLEDVLRVFGINMGLWLILRRGLPDDAGTPGQRFSRVLIAVVTYFAVQRGFTGLGETVLGESDLLESVVEGVSAFALTWGATELSLRLGLYRRLT